MPFNRRKLLIGIGGAIVGLPYLESLVRKKARVDSGPATFALFYRRANGVQQALFNRNFSQEPERWFPNLPYGAITSAALAAPPSQPQGCALSELAGYASRLAIIRGLRHVVTGTLNGHREGFIQGDFDDDQRSCGGDLRDVRRQCRSHRCRTGERPSVARCENDILKEYQAQKEVHLPAASVARSWPTRSGFAHGGQRPGVFTTFSMCRLPHS